jgi:integrase
MPTMKLTKRAIDAIGSVDKPTYFFDADLPGFFLRVMPTGARAWGLEYRAGTGRGAPKKRVTIAAFGKLTPDEARGEAKRLAGHVAKGGDPASEKAAKARELTVEGLVDLYDDEGCFVQRGIRQGEAMKPTTKAYTLARLRHHVVPLLGKKRVTEVGPGDIERFVRDVTAGKTAFDSKAAEKETGERTEGLKKHARIRVRGGEGAARKVVRDLSAVFSFAARRGIVPANPCDLAAVRKTDNKRERFLTLEEVKRLGEALATIEVETVERRRRETKETVTELRFNSKAVNITRLWALTGCRRNEIAALRWDEIDAERGLLIFADSKTGKSIRPLGAPALALLNGMPRDPESDFVFPAERGDAFYQGTKKIWPEAIKRAGLSGVTPHTLRHTLGSTAASTGEALALTGAILGHANHRSTAIYAHVQNDPSRRAADRVSKKIAAALEGKLVSEVVSMQARVRRRTE